MEDAHSEGGGGRGRETGDGGGGQGREAGRTAGGPATSAEVLGAKCRRDRGRLRAGGKPPERKPRESAQGRGGQGERKARGTPPLVPRGETAAASGRGEPGAQERVRRGEGGKAKGTLEAPRCVPYRLEDEVGERGGETEGSGARRAAGGKQGGWGAKGKLAAGAHLYPPRWMPYSRGRGRGVGRRGKEVHREAGGKQGEGDPCSRPGVAPLSNFFPSGSFWRTVNVSSNTMAWSRWAMAGEAGGGPGTHSRRRDP